MPLIWITWLRPSAISLVGYGCKIRNVSRCWLTLSNRTILATKQELFFTKLAPVQSITDTEGLDFLLILLPFNTTIYFFVKNFFPNVKISVNTIFECCYLFFRWKISHPLSTYATGGMEEGSSKLCTGAYKGREVSHLMCTHALTRT